MKKIPFSTFSKVLLLIASAMLLLAVFMPAWRIELTAPQYPEGLVLQLYTHKIAGDVDVINGLNHYIGMKTLHTEDFVEFKILPYIIVFFGLFALAAIIASRKKILYALFLSFVVFGVLAAVDFYRWNYDYGHNLDPNAAIRVPGMAYQPPLLGYKQLLNFGAYSIPDTGGWLMIAAGVLIFSAILKESGWLHKLRKTKLAVVLTLIAFAALSCTDHKAVPIVLHKDNCDFCKMGISDGKYGAELITTKGRVYKFDDIACMVHYSKEHKNANVYFIHDYAGENVLIPAETAFFITGGMIKSPMNGGLIGFSNEKEATSAAAKYKAKPISWQAILER